MNAINWSMNREIYDERENGHCHKYLRKNNNNNEMRPMSNIHLFVFGMVMRIEDEWTEQSREKWRNFFVCASFIDFRRLNGTVIDEDREHQRNIQTNRNTRTSVPLTSILAINTKQRPTTVNIYGCFSFFRCCECSSVRCRFNGHDAHIRWFSDNLDDNSTMCAYIENCVKMAV